MLYGGGFCVDEFFAGDHEGVVWVHGYGNVFEKNLEPGETIDIEPGGWLFRDHSVQMAQEVYGFKTGFLGGGGQPRLQPLHRPRARRAAERLLPPAGHRGCGRQAQREGGGGLSAASSAAFSTTRDGADALRARLPGGPSAAARDRRRARPRRYQLLVDVAGVGAGRLGPQAFLLVAPEPDPSLPDPGTQISLHQSRLRDEREWPRSPSSPPSSATCGCRVPARAGAPRAAQQGRRRQPRDRRDRRHDPRPPRADGCSAAVLRGRAPGFSRCRPAPRGSAAGPRRPRGAPSGVAGAGAARRVRSDGCAGRGARRPRLRAGAGAVGRSTRRRRSRPPSGPAARQPGQLVCGRPDRLIEGPARDSVPHLAVRSLCAERCSRMAGSSFPATSGSRCAERPSRSAASGKAGTTSHGPAAPVRAFDFFPSTGIDVPWTALNVARSTKFLPPARPPARRPAGRPAGCTGSRPTRPRPPR